MAKRITVQHAFDIDRLNKKLRHATPVVQTRCHQGAKTLQACVGANAACIAIPDAITENLTDLLHLCHLYDISFDECKAVAKTCFNQEAGLSFCTVATRVPTSERVTS
jgi:hypothetical protein